MKQIPDRWLNYKAIGNVVDGSNFIAFKVPLHKHISERLPIDERHTTENVVEAIPKLGIVINLTNTKSDTKYYSPRDWEQHGIEYKWIKTEGHVTPSQSNLVQFCRTVKDFLIGNPEKLIGVHCTHGLNRTGYFVCSYMVLCNNVSPSDAMRNFSVARGHQIERANYINSVMTHNSNQTLKEAVVERMSSNKESPSKSNSCSKSRSNNVAGKVPHKERRKINLRPVPSIIQPDRRQMHTNPRHRGEPYSRWDNARYVNQHDDSTRRYGRNDSHLNMNSKRIERPDNGPSRGEGSGNSSRYGTSHLSRRSERNESTSRWGERSSSQNSSWNKWVNQRMGNEQR